LDPFWDPFLTTFEGFWPFPALNATKIWDPLKRGVPNMTQNDPFWVDFDPILTHFGSYFDPFLGHFWTYFRPILTGFGSKRGVKMGPPFWVIFDPWDPLQGPYIGVLSTNSPIMALGGPPRGGPIGVQSTIWPWEALPGGSHRGPIDNMALGPSPGGVVPGGHIRVQSTIWPLDPSWAWDPGITGLSTWPGQSCS
jgi:hypothetical protein